MPQPDPRWDRLKDLFAAAAPIPAGERESFLKERGVGDATIVEVIALLEAHEPVDEQPGDTIGPYKLLENLGEGGFGTVWMAEQRSPVQRRVALKVLKAGMDSAQVLARFEQERQALALMQHPNIAQVYDAGTTTRGRPFFVMELVKGIPITDFASRERLTIQQRLELFVQVCRAVQHAHHKGVVHRDIKPRNVLVATADGRPLAKVIDFGIAKAVTGRLTERTLFTEHRAMVGTLEYMSPEQAEGLLDVDTRADVYSLGALLYELLTGSTPFVAAKLLEAGFGEMLRTLREVEPERPSARVSSKAGAGWAASGALGGRDPKQLFGSLRGDLDWVVMKALEKDRARRYGTADGLAADVERYLCGEAVEAVPPSLGYRVRKFVRRNRGAVAATLVVTLVLAIAAPLVWHFQRAHEVTQGRLDAKERESTIMGRISRLGSHAGRIATALTMANHRAHQPAFAELERCPEDLRRWEWHHAVVQVEESPRRLVSPEPDFWSMAQDGQHVLCLPKDSSRLEVFDSHTLQKDESLPLPFPDAFYVGMVGEGVYVDGHERRVYVHLATRTVREVDPSDDLYPAADGTYLAVRGDDFRVHDAQSGALVREFKVERESGADIQVFPMGRWILVPRERNPDRPGLLVDLDDPAHRIPVPSTCWINPCGTMHLGRTIWLFDESQGTVHETNWANEASDLLDYPSGAHAIAALRNAGCFVVDIRTGQTASPPLPISDGDGYIKGQSDPRGHRIYTGWMAIAPLSIATGEWLGPEPSMPDMGAALTDDGLHWIVNRPSGLEVTTARPPELSTSTERHPVLAMTTVQHHECLGIRGTTKDQDVIFVPDTGVPHRRSLPSSVLLAATSGDGTAHLRLLSDGRLVRTDSSGSTADIPFGTVGEIRSMALDHSGSHLAVIAGDRAFLHDLTKSGEPSDLGPAPLGSPAPAIAIAGDTMASGRQDGFVQLLTPRQRPRTTTWRLSEAAISHLSWSPDSTMLLLGSTDGSCAVMRTQDLGRAAKLEGHFGGVRGSAWSPDGKRVFTCAEDGTVRCWPTDSPSLEVVLLPLLTLTEPEIAGRPTTLLMTPDGERLACGYDDGSIRVWDSVPWRERIKHVPPLFPSSPK